MLSGKKSRERIWNEWSQHKLRQQSSLRTLFNHSKDIDLYIANLNRLNITDLYNALGVLLTSINIWTDRFLNLQFPDVQLPHQLSLLTLLRRLSKSLQGTNRRNLIFLWIFRSLLKPQTVKIVSLEGHINCYLKLSTLVVLGSQHNYITVSTVDNIIVMKSYPFNPKCCVLARLLQWTILVVYRISYGKKISPLLYRSVCI